MKDHVLSKIQYIQELIDQRKYQEANRLVSNIKAEIGTYQDGLSERLLYEATLGGILVDWGTYHEDESLIREGIGYIRKVLHVTTDEHNRAILLYNLGNGLSSLGKIQLWREWGQGKLNENLRSAAQCYYEAMALCDRENVCTSTLRNQITVNLANLLDAVGRAVEAIDLYESALERNPTMGEALGNKAIALFHLIPWIHGLKHRFFLEIHNLLESALSVTEDPYLRPYFDRYMKEIDAIMDMHKGEIALEEVTCPEPITNFHRFLQSFCAKHKLFLTPAVLLQGGSITVCEDPWFVNQMIYPPEEHDRIDKYITFMNQIKEDYILSRYLLAQSQYRMKDIDSVDIGVTLYYPLDYSIYGVYIQLLKAAFKIGVDTLDKIAFFVRDYFGVDEVPENKTSFRNIFSSRKFPLQLRPQLATHKNRYLLALLDLSLDLRNDGRLSFIYEIRNALTHRFLVIHDIVFDEDEDDRIHRVRLSEFIDQTIIVMQTVRSAFMYLVMAIETEEQEKGSSVSEQTLFEIRGIPVDERVRWRPPAGEL